MPVPSSTYRLQIRESFPLDEAAELCGYLQALGVGAVYCSPLLTSAGGSDHGYDVVRFDQIDPARGGREQWEHLLKAADEHGLGVVVDIVPNHAGVAEASENPAWWDVLKLGRQSRYAAWFDIDWTRGRLLVPVLGDSFDTSELKVDGEELAYYEHRFPIAPGTGLQPGESAADVHDRQHYELVNFRRADTEQNYRRFFAVVTLAGLRVEDEDVFATTHAEIRRWVDEDGIDGLRVDHPDGLVDPPGYVNRLRDMLGADRWLVIEKILEPGEVMPPDWPVDGTTGYDAMAEVGAVFVDHSAEEAFTEAYRELTGDRADFDAHVERGKRDVATTILRAEINRLALLAPTVERADEALIELVVAFPVYRSYLPTGAPYLAAAIEQARGSRPDLGDAISALAARLADPADELCRRFQQVTGAVMAKGVEDTAYYRYARFVAANEVGGDPGRFGMDLPVFHTVEQSRQQNLPRSMTALSTHDTKRGEDVRARLAVLSELPGEWRSLANRLMAAAPIDDRPFAYLLWQTFVGAGFIERERMHAYAEKAMREANTSTHWVDPVESFEATVHAAVDAAYDDPAVRDPLRQLVDRITPYGWTVALGQKLVQLTMPGIPDVYQGTELWEDSLVDPDNRRAVDFTQRRRLLEELDAKDGAPALDDSGIAKLAVTRAALRLRSTRPEAFIGYRPVVAEGPAAEHALAFDRGGAITVATRLPISLERRGGWQDTVLDLGGSVTDLLSGRSHVGVVPVADLLADLPVALLVRETR
jgi:(1->4)-alpha-D-glucan 1-alpha-D-glucosylmutase